MRHIRSIVVFNSATAGDFLTSLCWSQLSLPSDLCTQVTSGRVIVKNFYFKNITTKLFHDPTLPADFDYDQIFPVENSHYWLECYKTMADRCVYIDYPEHTQQQIMEIYLEKVFDNDKQKMVERNLPNQNPNIAKHITVDNIENILNIHWLKNIRAWRNNCDMSAIYLADFFDRSKMQNIVAHLINQDLSDESRFDQIYHAWIEKNHKLSSLF
jgi:hypothetical protein